MEPYPFWDEENKGKYSWLQVCSNTIGWGLQPDQWRPMEPEL